MGARGDRLRENRPDRIFREVNHREKVFWMTDLIFYAALKRLTAGPSPLLMTEQMLEVTGSGRAVLAGDADSIGLNGIDRRLGGFIFMGANRPGAGIKTISG
ncbi:MAG: hypothetical protein MPW14_18185 [Candidatus Manganitrophus sp.]|nr:MAG: hypothetical protein MPW14_18185 [Candidatus Manganitrophus sp.]